MLANQGNNGHMRRCAESLVTKAGQLVEVAERASARAPRIAAGTARASARGRAACGFGRDGEHAELRA